LEKNLNELLGIMDFMLKAKQEEQLAASQVVPTKAIYKSSRDEIRQLDLKTILTLDQELFKQHSVKTAFYHRKKKLLKKLYDKSPSSIVKIDPEIAQHEEVKPENFTNPESQQLFFELFRGGKALYDTSVADIPSIAEENVMFLNVEKFKSPEQQATFIRAFPELPSTISFGRKLYETNADDISKISLPLAQLLNGASFETQERQIEFFFNFGDPKEVEKTKDKCYKTTASDVQRIKDLNPHVAKYLDFRKFENPLVMRTFFANFATLDEIWTAQSKNFIFADLTWSDFKTREQQLAFIYRHEKYSNILKLLSLDNIELFNANYFYHQTSEDAFVDVYIDFFKERIRNISVREINELPETSNLWFVLEHMAGKYQNQHGKEHFFKLLSKEQVEAIEQKEKRIRGNYKKISLEEIETMPKKSVEFHILKKMYLNQIHLTPEQRAAIERKNATAGGGKSKMVHSKVQRIYSAQHSKNRITKCRANLRKQNGNARRTPSRRKK
jgi:hypothetical protein